MAEIGLLGTTTDVLAQRAMLLSNQSEQYIADNLANAETPGYKARQLSFRAQLAQALASGPAAVARVSGTVVIDAGASRPDGSSVNMTQQMVSLAHIQLYYGMAQQALSAKANTIATITQGKVV